MLEFPDDAPLIEVESGKVFDAKIVKLTRDLAKKQMDAAWWQIGGSKSKRKEEADHQWRWVEILGDFRRSQFGELMCLQTEDSEIQGAIGYWTNGKSLIEPDAHGAIFVNYLATAPRNRFWLVDNPCFLGVGTSLLYYAVCHSYILGLEGRVTLVSLPTEKTREFYVSRGFTEISKDEDGMIEMELEPSVATAWLREKRRNPMKRKKSKQRDFSPVTGGVDRSKYLRDDVVDVCDVVADSDIDVHIVRLLSLHPDLAVRFRNQDLAQMDDKTKQALLDDINDVLGIQTLSH